MCFTIFSNRSSRQHEPSFEEEVQSAIAQLKLTDIKRSVDELVCSSTASISNTNTATCITTTISNSSSNTTSTPKSNDTNVSTTSVISANTATTYVNPMAALFPGKSIDSDEVRVMQKVLQNEISLDPEECVDLLNRTDWDVHRAIKAVRLREALRTHRVTLSECDWIGTLRKFNWNVRQASNYLIATQGSSEGTTEV